MPTGLDTYLSQYMNPIAGGDAQSSGGSLGRGMGGGTAPQPRMSPGAAPSGGGNPFNHLFDPSRGGLLSLLGGAMGAPTREEWMADRAGRGTQGAMMQLQQSLAKGKTAQQAVMELVNSEAGMALFTSVGDPMGEIKKMVDQLVAETPEPIKMGPGDALIQQQADGSYEEAFRNPMGETQEFLELAEIGQLSPEEQTELARAQQFAKTSGDTTQTERATAGMVQKGLITPDQAMKINAGVYQFQPIRNGAGDITSYVLMDMTTGAQVQGAQVQPGGASPGDPNYAPGVNDDGYNPEDRAEPGMYLSQFANPADIVEGVGPVPLIGEKAGGLIANIMGGEYSNLGKEYGKMRRALDQIRNDARGLKDTGRYIKSDLELLDSMLPSTSSMFESPAQAAEALISYRIWLEQRIGIATEKFGDPNGTNESRGKAKLELGDLDKAIRNVPSVESLQAKITELQSSGSPVVEGVKSGMETLNKVEGDIEAGTVGKPQAAAPAQMPVYDDQNTVRDHLYSGQLQYGTTIMYKGKPMRVDRATPKGAK